MDISDEKRLRDRRTIEQAFARQSAKDVEGFLELFADDVVTDVPWQVPGFSGHNTGVDELRNDMKALDLFDPFVIHIVGIEPLLDPDRWLVEAKSDAVVVPTGRPYHQNYIHLLRLRDGKIAEWTVYQNPLNQIEAFDLQLPQHH